MELAIQIFKALFLSSIFSRRTITPSFLASGGITVHKRCKAERRCLRAEYNRMYLWARETYLLGTSCHQPLLSSGSSLACSKLMGDSREPNFKTSSPSLLSVFVCFKAWHSNWTPTHSGNFPFESLESWCRKMRGFSSWSSDVGRTCAATSARTCQEYGRTPELVSGAGAETNKPLIFPRSHPSRNYSILEHKRVLFLAAFSGAFNFLSLSFFRGLVSLALIL